MSSTLVRYRISLGFFIFGLIVSGLTTFPLQWELSVLTKIVGPPTGLDNGLIEALRQWIAFVDAGIREIDSRFPVFFYGTDWLGFGHLVIAAFFLLPFSDPVRYRGVLVIGLAACLGVLVLAFVCGPIRGIPLGWRWIDSSFGIIGAIPLLYCLRLTKEIDRR